MSSSQPVLVSELRRIAEIQIDVRAILAVLVVALWFSAFAVVTSEPHAAVLLPVPDGAHTQLP